MATMTTEQLQSRGSLREAIDIEPSLKIPIDIAESVPRMLSLQTFIKDLSKSRRGFSFRRPSKASSSVASRTQVEASQVDNNTGRLVSNRASFYPEPTPAAESLKEVHPTSVVKSPGTRGVLAASHSPADNPLPPEPSPLGTVSRPPDGVHVADITDRQSLTPTIKGKATEQDSTGVPTSELPAFVDPLSISPDRLHKISKPLLKAEHGIQQVRGPEQIRRSTLLSQQSIPLHILDGAGEASSRHVNSVAKVNSAPFPTSPTYTSPARTISVLSPPRGVPMFRKLSDNSYEALRLRPDENSRHQFTTTWKPTIMKRLRDMHLGQHTITNLRFCMTGYGPNKDTVKPTILVVCTESKRKEVEMGLNFIRLSIPTSIEFKIISSIIKLASGVSVLQDEEKSKLGARIRFSAPGSLDTLVGIQMRIQARDRRALYPICTIGGIIIVGDTLYALSVAHSMFGVPAEVEDHYSILDWISFGKVKSYDWAGNDSQDLALSDGSLLLDREDDQPKMDWMLTQLGSQFMLPNLFQELESASQQGISGFWKTVDLTDGDVCVCAGVTGTQYGILDTTPTSILYGQTSYEVLSIALEHPLADGDSGAWVVRDGKPCGYVFARIDEQPWGYMLPIEPVFQDISRASSSKDYAVPVDVPSASTISFLRSLAPRYSSATSSLNFDLAPAPSIMHVRNRSDEAGPEILQPMNVTIPVAPTRDAPAPPTIEHLDGEADSASIPHVGDRPPRSLSLNEILDTAVPGSILSQLGARHVATRPVDRDSAHTETTVIVGPRRTYIKLQHSIGIIMSSVTVRVGGCGLSYVILLAFCLGLNAGLGYLIYYIVKKTSLPVYAKVLAIFAAVSVGPTLYAAFFWLKRKPKVLPAQIANRPRWDLPAMTEVTPSRHAEMEP